MMSDEKWKTTLAEMREKMKKTLEEMEPGAKPRFYSVEPWMDPRLPIIAQMAAVIYVEKSVYNGNQEARRLAVDQAFLLYGEIAIRLAENDR